MKKYPVYFFALTLLIVCGFVLMIMQGCSRPKTPVTDLNVIDTSGSTMYIDSGRSSIVINNSGDSTRCYDIKSLDYKIVQIAPEGEFINYIVKQYTSTITCDGQEGQKRTIGIELKPVDRPNHVAYYFKHDADELILEHDYYKTVFYGCCDAEPIHKIYNYHGSQLLTGNVTVLIGAIPNNPIKFFVGYTPSVNDTSILGSVHIAFDSTRIYRVDIMSHPLPPDLCSQYSPVLSLVPLNPRDTLDVYEDEYQLWDLEAIQSAEEIRGVAIQVMYQCEIYYQVEPVVIPISNGKPFGEDSLIQHVPLIHLTEEEN